MKKLLYIGHAFHNKTKSTQFLKELFKTRYEVTVFDFDPYNDSYEIFSKLKGLKFDIVILFQIMPPISALKINLSFNLISFFPMYDGVPPIDNPIWREYKECNIINFSKTLHKQCKAHGFSSFYIQFFPQPKQVINWGDEHSVFFWQRINVIPPHIIGKTLNIEEIKTIYLHQVPDPCQNAIDPPAEWKNKVKISTWFDTKEEMETYMQQAAIYYAPRKYEGIGMSFLDAMALGRCVIAPDCPTMNEYIQNGKTGYLYNIDNPLMVEPNNIRTMQENSIKFINNGYINWEKRKNLILQWIEQPPSDNFNLRLFVWAYGKSIIKQLLKKMKKNIKMIIKKTSLFQVYKRCIINKSFKGRRQ